MRCDDGVAGSPDDAEVIAWVKARDQLVVGAVTVAGGVEVRRVTDVERGVLCYVASYPSGTAPAISCLPRPLDRPAGLK